MYYSPPDYKQIVLALQSLLSAIGLPRRQILFNPSIEFSQYARFDADVVVVADDLETILFQFEIKLTDGKPDVAYDHAKKALRGLWRHHRCFAVTNVIETIQMAEIREDEKEKWIPLSDTEQIAKLLGDPKEEATRQAVRIGSYRRETMAKNCKSLLWWIGVVGGATLASSIVGELFGKELSWKIYYLLTLVIGMIAAAHGLVFYVKVGESEVRIMDRGRTLEESGLTRTCENGEFSTDAAS